MSKHNLELIQKKVPVLIISEAGCYVHVLNSCVKYVQYIFSQSLMLQRNVTEILTKSIIVPVAKTRSPQELNDFRPEALTSLVMKCLEKVVKINFFSNQKIDLIHCSLHLDRAGESRMPTLHC